VKIAIENNACANLHCIITYERSAVVRCHPKLARENLSRPERKKNSAKMHL
jgi:hypothetical protein